ncbi:hypothetical protein ACOSQ4_032323 [Xanthoceras sorbifolium]
METRGKTNSKFQNEVYEILAWHKSSFDLLNTNFNQVNAALQTVLTELQALCITPNPVTREREINPFSQSIPNLTNVPPPPFQERNHTQLKLFFPKFGGEDPAEWIYKAEQYFEFKDVNPTYQVQFASFHLEGIALQWHRWITKFCGPLTWEEFTKALLTKAFEKLSHRVDGLLEEFLVGCFVAGLKDEIRFDVKVKDPSTLYEAIGNNLICSDFYMLLVASCQVVLCVLLSQVSSHKYGSLHGRVRSRVHHSIWAASQMSLRSSNHCRTIKAPST